MIIKTLLVNFFLVKLFFITPTVARGKRGHIPMYLYHSGSPARMGMLGLVSTKYDQFRTKTYVPINIFDIPEHPLIYY